MSDTAEVIADRPTTETKGERTRRTLLELAIDRFGRRGYRATSVSEIARAAGLTQAAVYAYFANKEDLFDAAVDADAEALLRGARTQVEDVPVTSLVPAFLISVFGLLEAHPLAQRVLAGQESEVMPRLVDLPAIRQFTAFVAEKLSDGQAAGAVRSDIETDDLAAGMEALVLGLLFSLVQSGGVATPRHQRGVVAAFDAMVRPAP
ncbi:MAG: TetR/AcrR family transcriptional regulator [Acidimicrobiia bacterium]|nr:TetR/AcrR family transcriptional regulator [Acidimicrobiia bacterium]